MRKTIYPLLAFMLLFFIGCAPKSDELFNGKDLSNWDFVLKDTSVPASDVYKVIDGQIYIKGEPWGYMYTKKKYKNFNLELEYRWESEGSNSGVFVIIEETKNPFPKGIEAQLFNQNAGDFVLLGGSDLSEFQLAEGETERPDFPVVEKNTHSTEKPIGEWNKVEISVYDGVIDVFINGVHQNTGTSPATVGHVGLQSEGGGIFFRNLKLTEVE